MTCCFPTSSSRRDCDSFFSATGCRTDGGNDSVRKFGGGVCFTSTGPLTGGLVSFYTKFFSTAIATGLTAVGACGCAWGGYMACTGQFTPCDYYCCASRSEEEDLLFEAG